MSSDAPIFEDAPALPRWIESELPFRRRVALVDGRRIHFVDEGAGRPVLLVHGNPTWCFHWRKVIARLRERGGLRLIAPDLLGLGLSEKLPHPSDHRLEVHARAIARLTEVLELEDAIVVAQDWGGPIGVGAAMIRSEGGAPFLGGLVLGNTAVLEPKRPLRTTAFHRFSHMPIASDLAFRGLLFPVPVLHRAQGERRSIGLAREGRLRVAAPPHARSRGAARSRADGARSRGSSLRALPRSARHVRARVQRPRGAGVG
jgi:pimeloyl-ACP methyl ester carboxylesterase